MLTLLRPVAAVLLCLFLVACDSAEEQAEQHFQTALALVEEGDYDRAAVEFRNVFRLNGQHAEAREAFADMLMEQGDVSRANAQYLRLAEQEPSHAGARRALTLIAMDNQNWPEIERHGTRLGELDPDSDVARVAAIALAYRDATEDRDSAGMARVAADAAKAIEANPDIGILRFILIQQAMNDTDLDGALDQLDALLAQRPDLVQLHLMRLQILGSLDRLGEVETSLIDLVDRFPDREEFLPTLLQFYGSQGRAADAVTFLRGYVAERPDARQAMNTLIEIVVNSESPEAGLAEIDRLTEVGENLTILATQRARIMFEMGQREEAIAAIEEIVNAADATPGEDLSTAKVVLARMLLASGNEVGARRQVEEVLAEDTTNGPAIKMQAVWLTQDDKPDEAVTLLRTAIDNNPDDWEAMLLMADAFSRSGSHELARDFVSLAVDTSNNAPGPTLRFANLLVEEDRLLLAEETLVASLRANPDNLQILTMLGRVQVAREDWSRVAQVEETLRRIGTDDAIRVAAGLEVSRLASQSRVDEALGALETINNDEGSIQTLAALVRAKLSTGDGDEALALAQDALDADPDNQALKLIVASTLVGIGQIEEGRAGLEALIAENDQIEGAWTTLVRIASVEGDTAARDDLLDRGLAAMPNSAALAWAKASVLTEAGDAEAAIAIYEDIYARNSNSQLIANNLATLLANTRDDEASLDRAYSVARRLRGSDVPAFQDTYGWIAFRRGDAEEALPYLQDAAASLPEEPSVLYHLGMVYLELGQKEDALKQFQTAVSIDANPLQFPEIALSAEEASKLEAEGVTPAE